jgi:hypothetical protein
MMTEIGTLSIAAYKLYAVINDETIKESVRRLCLGEVTEINKKISRLSTQRGDKDYPNPTGSTPKRSVLHY